MYWVCFGDSAKGCLAMARKALDPSLDVEQILALSDDYAQGDIRDVTDRAARADILVPWRGDPELDGKWQADYQAQHWKALEQLDEVDEAVIWYAKGNALEQCGLRYVVSRLYQKHIPVWVVEVDWMPMQELSKSTPIDRNDGCRSSFSDGMRRGWNAAAGRRGKRLRRARA